MKTQIQQKEISINQNGGFSIIETLVAIFILLIAITGPMVFAQSSLRIAFQSRDQITAFYLAQDAIEFVKNTRDHRALARSDGDWLGPTLQDCFIDPLDGVVYGCTIDTNLLVTNSVAVLSCATPEPGCEQHDKPLKRNNSGYFGFDGSTDSIFYRTIYIEEIVPNQEAQVVVKIKWTSHDVIGVREITVAENIYNWPNELLRNPN